MRAGQRLLFGTAIGLAAGLAGGITQAEKVEEGKQVAIEYLVRLDDGTVADTNKGREPLVFEQGTSLILPALEEKLVGMEPGDELEVSLPPEQAYGPVDPNAVREVEASKIPEEARRVGASVVIQDETGSRRQVRVSRVTEDTVTLDYNHPLAGKTLHYKVKIISVE